ncbi:MAG: type II secretion system F family protein [Candidatus Staskawiczbacteria bacterium]|nr:type II secretion system F family protein [Candidatus Staskawiczbacteria bacterium]
MPNFNYTAKTADGATKTGVSSAKDLSQLAQNLKNDGLILINGVSEQEKLKRKNIFSKDIFGGVSVAEKILITKNLWFMISAGMAPVKCFEILSTQTKKKSLKDALLDIKEDINKGDTLAGAFSLFPNIFSDLYRNMIKVAEESGTLEEALSTLCIQMEREHEIKSKVKNAMIYPAVICITILAVGFILVFFILPKLSQFFNSLHAKLPWYTKAVIGLGQLSPSQWGITMVVFAIIAVAGFFFLRTKMGERVKFFVFMRIPLIAKLVKENNAAILMRVLHSLISSGVPVVKSLEIASGTVTNFYYKKALLETAEKVKKGENISKSLAVYKEIFPAGTIEMIEVGESTGKIALTLKNLAEFYEKEAIGLTDGLLAAIEPVLILFFGVAVGFFAVAIIEPLYSSLGAI